MLQNIAFAILAFFLWFEMSAGQTAYIKNDNPFSPGVSGSNSGAFAPSFNQDFSSSAPLNNENIDQVPTEPSSSFIQTPFLPSVPSSTVSSTSPISNPSAAESFISEFKSAVYTSKMLPDIFDLRELSAEPFSKSLYDYVYANGVDVTHGDPHYIASMVAAPIKDGIDTFTLPVMLDIYGNVFAKYLFGKGILDSSNASSLAKKFAKIVEDNAERAWVKDTPESKFLVLEDSFVQYVKDVDHFNMDTIEELSVQFADEVKRFASKS